MPFVFQKLKIPDVIIITPKIFMDARGFFIETFKQSDFAQNGIKEHFVQDNYSKSTRGVIRGLHYQKKPKAQAKLVRCTKGVILDVAVDLRKGSPTYRDWVSAILTEENKKILYIPAGFAHGFAVMSNEAEIAYKTSEEYSYEDDRGIRWNDPAIGVNWEIENPVLSNKDLKQPFLIDADINFTYGEI